MVFRGTPSRACLRCRQRKLHCDLRKQTCGQCSRADAVCSGYRDPDELRVLDESEKARLRVLGRDTLTMQGLKVPIEEQARNAFYSHFVQGLSSSYDVLDQITAPALVDPHLTLSIDTVSLAFFSFQFHSSQAARMAREKYLSTLPVLNEALGTLSSARRDSTLLSVLLLDLFEKISSADPRSPESWMGHVRGALALIRLREEAQFQHHVGLRLSIRLFTNSLISCVAAETGVPPELLKLRHDLEQHLKKADPKWQMSGLMIKYAGLRAHIRGGTLSLDELLKKAQDLDAEFLALSDSMPASWSSQSFPAPEATPRVLEGHFDVYQTCHATQTNNVILLVRILLNTLIRRTKQELAIHQPGARWEDCQEDETIEALARKICASAAQFTAYPNFRRPRPVKRSVQQLHCYTLIFPFFVAATHASDCVKSWILDQLDFLATEMSIRNAMVVADVLRRAERTTPWEIYALLGSYAMTA